jgi:hypothetical protein
MMKRSLLFLLVAISLAFALEGSKGTAAERGSAEWLEKAGCLDVTAAPYLADPSGTSDSTEAIQRAVNDARDRALVCFFPEGTYLISDTISCEQQVEKLDRPRNTDGHTQHYWDKPHRIVMCGSTKGRRPVLKLSHGAKGFDNPLKPKLAVWIWAQTRHDAPGKEEPNWGEEWAGISFSHIFRGIDIDIRGHAGAIGIRHSGSQGSAMLDCTIQADGAYAGMNNCCGQGGGTYNMEVVGGQYGIVIDPNSRFPILTVCSFTGQVKSAIRYAKGGSQVPTLLVGCRLEPAGSAAIDFTTERSYAGINMVDCVFALKPGSVIAKTAKNENIYIENSFAQGATSVCTESGKLPAAATWTHIQRYSSHTQQGVNLCNGVESTGEIVACTPAATAPDIAAIRNRHYRQPPSFEDDDVVDVKSFGAKGDGSSDDSKAFENAIKSHDKVFVPKGNYRLSGTLRLGRNTQLFGLAGSRSVLSSGGEAGGKKAGRWGKQGDSMVVATPDDAQAAPGLFLLSVQGRVDWKSGQGTMFLAPASVTISGHGGGKIYGMMARGGQLLVKGIHQPLSFYALNVERKGTNPQSEFADCQHLRIYYFKVEAGTVNSPNARDANTPSRISQSSDVRVYCMYGNVKKLEGRPMLEIVDSTDIVVSQLKAFQPGSFPHVIETVGQQKTSIPSSKTCTLLVRDAEPHQP